MSLGVICGRLLVDPSPKRARHSRSFQVSPIRVPTAYCSLRISPVAAVPSNSPHVVIRVQHGKERQSYGVTYREAQQAIEAEVPEKFDARARAYLLLKRHGQDLCKRTKPKCWQCPVSSSCAFFAGNRRGRSTRRHRRVGRCAGRAVGGLALACLGDRISRTWAQGRVERRTGNDDRQIWKRRSLQRRVRAGLPWRGRQRVSMAVPGGGQQEPGVHRRRSRVRKAPSRPALAAVPAQGRQGARAAGGDSIQAGRAQVNCTS